MKNPFPALFSKSLFLTTALALSPTTLLANQNGDDRIEVAFVIDTTGSMANLIEGAKRKIWSIANTIVDINPDADIRMGMVAYRDYGDQYVVRKYDLSTDIQGLYGNLISFQAAGGGDTPEAVNEALQASIRGLSWSLNDNSTRLVFLVGDAPPHMDYNNGPKYPQIIRNARNSGITIHAIQAGRSNRTRQVWSEIARLSGGSYIPIPQDGGQIAVIETPYDDEILQLQKRIDQTVIPYGNERIRSRLHKKLATRSIASRASRVENSKFYSKRSRRKEVVTGGADIVGALVNKDLTFDKIKQDSLPDDIRKLSKPDQRALITKKLRQRAALEKQMVELVEKQESYTAKQRIKLAREKGKTADTSFDRAVSDAIRKAF